MNTEVVTDSEASAPADASALPVALPTIELTDEQVEDLRERIIDVMRTIYDPEIPVNIYDLGLIYGINIANNGAVHVEMTLTAPGCPVAQTFPGTVEQTVLTVDDVSTAKVELVWEPAWTQDRMTEAARYQLNMF